MNTNSLLSTNLGALSGTNDIRAIKPPVEIPNLWLWIIAGVVFVLLVASGVLLWLLLRKKAGAPVLTPPIPPHDRARKKLHDALALIDQPRPFCTLVSDTVRYYLEERFKFHAPERTTEEFLHELQSTRLLLPDQKQSLGEFLSVCDMVKFARYEPQRTELETLHNSAMRLIDETEPEPAPDKASSLPPTQA